MKQFNRKDGPYEGCGTCACGMAIVLREYNPDRDTSRDIPGKAGRLEWERRESARSRANRVAS